MYTQEGRPEGDGADPGARESRVTGLFRRSESAAEAVERLVAEEVPPDAVHVFAVDESGEILSRLEIGEEPGATRGALLGALAGAAVGLAAVLLGLLGVLGLEDGWAWPTVLGAIAIVGASAAAGVPAGSALRLGRGRRDERLARAKPRSGAILVAVDGAPWAEPGRRVLREAGAERVSG
ncbi:MAG TPA: hypothetical protein VFQ22_04910 [Longimicrobiales bacterium]|nr:hypothetical protein [Longimicrobiales bacterium]